MIFFTKQELLDLQQKNINRFGGSHGLRDDGAFKSAMEAPANRHFIRTRMQFHVPPLMPFIYARYTH